MSAGIAGKPLQNAKHESVLQSYVADPERVGYRCYVRVYPKSSEAAAKTAFSRLLKNADFAARLAFLDAAVTEKVVESTAITVERVIGELAKIGFANLKNYIGVTGDGDPYVRFADLSDDEAAAVSSITVEDYKDGRGEDARDVKKVSFRLHDKRAALVSIGQHLGAFVEKHKHEHTGKDGEPIKVEAEISELELARRIAFALEQGARSAKPAAAAPAPKRNPKKKGKSP
jgi:phage terminase small subunit